MFGWTTVVRRAHSCIELERLTQTRQIAPSNSEPVEHLALPFATKVLGNTITVVRVEMRGDRCLVAICEHGRHRQAIPLGELPLPSPRPEGAEWIAAYKQWLG